MSDKLWKATERAVAKRLGGQRVPVSGRARGDVPDIKHPWLAVEVKSRQTVPAWLREAMVQARAAASTTQLPIVVLHEVGQRHDADLVVLTLRDFREWFGPDIMREVVREGEKDASGSYDGAGCGEWRPEPGGAGALSASAEPWSAHVVQKGAQVQSDCARNGAKGAVTAADATLQPGERVMRSGHAGKEVRG